MNKDERYIDIRQSVWIAIQYVLLLIVTGVSADLVLRKIYGDALQANTIRPIIFISINIFAAVIIIKKSLKQINITSKKAFPFFPFNFRLLLSIMPISLGMSVMLSELDNLVRYILPMPDFLLKDIFEGRDGFLQSIFDTAITVPVIEELLFRGLILSSFLKIYNEKKSIVASAFIFAMAHLNPWQFFTGFLAGLLLGWIFSKTRSLIPCIVVHSLNNLMPFIILKLPIKISGFNTSPEINAFQPFWFNIFGLALLIVSIWWFLKINDKKTKAGLAESAI